MTPEYNAFLEAYNNMDIDNLTDDELMQLEITFQNKILEIQRELRRRGMKKPTSDAAIVLRFAAIVFIFGLLTGLVIAHIIYCGTL